MTNASPSRSSPLLLLLLAAALAFPTYGGVYAWARVTHRLVNYGTFIARPNAMSGIGHSPWELAFFPLIELEGTLRAH